MGNYLASLAGFADLTSGVLVCYVKTGRLLETNRYFNLDPEPLKALQSPFFVRNLLESSWKSPYLFQGRAFTCGINGEKQFSRTPADQNQSTVVSTRRSESPDLTP